MRFACWAPLFLASVLLGQSKNTAPKRGSVSEAAQVVEEVLRNVVSKRCQETLCLLAVKGKALDAQHLATLAQFGQVAAPAASDLKLDESGMSGAARSRGAQVIDILKVTVERDTAVAQVHVYSSIIDTTLCRYRVQRAKSGWHVEEPVECTA
jgi:hypothetical protein